MEIDKIAGPLRKVLREREIIARCELLLRTYDIVRAADLCEEEREELQKIVGKKIAPGIFVSIMSKEPAFFDLPRLDTFTQMDGRIFHFLHTKKHSKQDFAEANRKFLNSMPELRRIMYQSLKDLLVEFMSDAGYRLTSEETGELVFSAPERKARAFVATSVRSLDIDKCRGEQGEDVVALVPSGENLEPFMQFYQENGLVIAPPEAIAELKKLGFNDLAKFEQQKIDLNERYKQNLLANETPAPGIELVTP